MRGAAPLSRPIVLGAGPAGSAAAIHLARAGKAPILIDRDAEARDCICGGFLSWRTAVQLRDLDCPPERLGAHEVSRLRLFAGKHRAEVPLVQRGFGLSRRALDSALRDAALASGARLEIDRAREIREGCIIGERSEWRSPAIFLATGKHDIRGLARPRRSADPAVGLRVRLPAGSPASQLVEDCIELHLFRGGYAGIVLHEEGSTNICLAVRKSLLKSAGGDPRELLKRLASENFQLAPRMDGLDEATPIDTIASVPYGWIARDGSPGLYRLGDQAAVIPSLAGEGMSIALASAEDAVRAWCSGDAERFQGRFARRARTPLAVAGALWHLAERPAGSSAMISLARRLPPLASAAMHLSRI